MITFGQKNNKRSEEYFHRKPENYNCAQAVLKGWQEEYGLSDTIIEEFRAWGGGRAAGGVCGALYAAEFLLQRSETAESVSPEFQEIAGSIRCLELKESGFPCVEAVRLADRLLAERRL